MKIVISFKLCDSISSTIVAHEVVCQVQNKEQVDLLISNVSYDAKKLILDGIEQHVKVQAASEDVGL